MARYENTHMDIKIRNEITRLTKLRDFHHISYIAALDINDEKLRRIDEQIARSTSATKTAILEKQRQVYLTEIEKNDKNIENITTFFTHKIETLENQLSEKKTLSHTIDTLKNAIERRNTDDIFTMFEHVLHALTLIEEGSSCTQPCS